MKINELYEIVEELNIDLYESHKVIDMYYELRTTGNVDVILFNGIELWCSESDDRTYDPIDDAFEPLMPYIKKQFNELVNKLQTFKYEI